MQILKQNLLIILLSLSFVSVALPPDMQADRYLVQVEKALKGKDKDYNKAAEAMDKIMALKDQHNLELPIEFYFKYAKVLLKSETKPNEAFTAINYYLTTTGKSGANYSEALDLYNQAESQIEQNKLRTERDRLQAEQDRLCKVGTRIGKYITHCDTVVDPRKNIMWARCSVGQTWTGSTCDKLGRTLFDKYDALEIAKTSNYAGYSDWRLPTINELHTLVYCSSGQRESIKTSNGKCIGTNNEPVINQNAFPNTYNHAYISSHETALVSFHNGREALLVQDYIQPVRLVRDVF